MPHSLIYLASQSPRRQELLQRLGVRFELLLPDANENAEDLEATRANEAPARYVQRVTLAKAHAALDRLAARKLPPAPVLVADTTVALGRTILGKPDSPAHARQMLRTLSGQTHRVLTAVVVALPENIGKSKTKSAQFFSVMSESKVQFRALTNQEINAYIASQEPFGKAGAYALQGLGDVLIERVNGSVTGVVGLPLSATLALLQRARVKTALG